jgi:hypothetical protein
LPAHGDAETVAVKLGQLVPVYEIEDRFDLVAVGSKLLLGHEWILRRESEAICSASAVRPQRREGVRMAGFLFRLETTDGVPAEPPTLEAAIPNWGVGDRIYLGRRTLQVVGRRDDDEGQPPVLIVEDVAEQGTSAVA